MDCLLSKGDYAKILCRILQTLPECRIWGQIRNMGHVSEYGQVRDDTEYDFELVKKSRYYETACDGKKIFVIAEKSMTDSRKIDGYIVQIIDETCDILFEASIGIAGQHKSDYGGHSC